MRIAVLSDIHGNLEAFEAVLADVARVGADALYSLGDIVGYGPCPAACIDLVRGRAAVSLSGNHDAAVAGFAPLEDFNEFARSALEWTSRQLAAGQIDYLGSLSYSHRGSDLLCVHATPLEPARWHYLHGTADLAEQFAAFAERVCLVGHTHRPGICGSRGGGDVVRCGATETLRPGVRYLVNAGSVGQPRDRDPRASYAVLDCGRASVELRRVDYPLARTQERMRSAGLPAFLIERLAAGL